MPLAWGFEPSHGCDTWENAGREGVCCRQNLELLLSRCFLSYTLQGELGEAITLMAPAAFQSGLPALPCVRASRGVWCSDRRPFFLPCGSDRHPNGLKPAWGSVEPGFGAE